MSGDRQHVEYNVMQCSDVRLFHSGNSNETKSLTNPNEGCMFMVIVILSVEKLNVLFHALQN